MDLDELSNEYFGRAKRAFEDARKKIGDAALDKAVSLDLSDMGLCELPPELFSLSSLEKLVLDDNKITYIPEEISNLANLRHLSVKGNGIMVCRQSWVLWRSWRSCIWATTPYPSFRIP